MYNNNIIISNTHYCHSSKESEPKSGSHKGYFNALIQTSAVREKYNNNYISNSNKSLEYKLKSDSHKGYFNATIQISTVLEKYNNNYISNSNKSLESELKSDSHKGYFNATIQTSTVLEKYNNNYISNSNKSLESELKSDSHKGYFNATIQTSTVLEETNIPYKINAQEILAQLLFYHGRHHDNNCKITMRQDQKLELSKNQSAAIDNLNKKPITERFTQEHRDQIKCRIEKPYLIDQTKYSTCGVAALMMVIAEKFPQTYADMIYDLITTGKSEFPFNIQLRQTSQKSPICSRDVDEILITSMRNTQNYILPLNTGRGINDIAGLTTPTEIEAWLKTIINKSSPQQQNKCPPKKYGASADDFPQVKLQVINTMEIFNKRNKDKELASLIAFCKKYPQAQIILYLKTQLSDQITHYLNLGIQGDNLHTLEHNQIEKRQPRDNLLLANVGHYVVLKSIKYADHNTGYVKFELYTYGNRIKYKISKEAFLEGYKGYIAAILPEKISQVPVKTNS